MTNEEVIKQMFGDKKEEKVTPKEETSPVSYAENRRLIDEKKAELEVKRLEIEIKKLEQPNTSLDYFKQMLDIQQSHAKDLMEMQNKNFETRLEIERLKLGNGDSDYLDILKDFLPYLPQILANQQKTAVAPNFSSQKTSAKQVKIEDKPKVEENITEEKKGGVDNNMDKLEAYKKMIIAGEISEEQAYEDFKKEMPDYAKVTTKKQFHKIFMQIKTGVPQNPRV